MAKGQKKSNREAKKPKASKKAPAVSASPFSQPPTTPKKGAPARRED